MAPGTGEGWEAMRDEVEDGRCERTFDGTERCMNRCLESARAVKRQDVQSEYSAITRRARLTHIGTAHHFSYDLVSAVQGRTSLDRLSAPSLQGLPHHLAFASSPPTVLARQILRSRSSWL